MLVTGQALGDALDALHERGVVHGDVHPGAVALAESGEVALSPWPLAPRPEKWGGAGGFGSDPDEPRHVSPTMMCAALGAVLLGALAGPPVLSSEQVGNVERELEGRAPRAVAIADHALTPPSRGGYEVVAQLRDDCAAALAGQPVTAAVTDAETDDFPDNFMGTTSAAEQVRDGVGGNEKPEGRWAALVVAGTGAAVVAGLWVSGTLGASPRVAVHPVTTHAAACAAAIAASRCRGPAASLPASVAATPAGGQPRLASHPVTMGSGGSGGPSGSRAAQGAASADTSTSTLSNGPTSTTTTAPSSTSSSSTTATSSPTTGSTTTSPSSTTTTTTSTSTTTSSDPSAAQAGPDGHSIGSGN